MKPNFALTMSYEGIGLLHRAGFGWDLVGDVPLEAKDLGGELAKLRKRALEIESNGVQTKLVLPNQQIRFLQFEAEGLNVGAIGAAVQQQLNGATPYALDELAYDWSISAGQVFIAAVARETLVEAESFATKHGFEPLCFVAAPDPQDFLGEPWFGQTDFADTVLSTDTELERDTVAIRITGVIEARHEEDGKEEDDLSISVQAQTRSGENETERETNTAKESKRPDAPMDEGDASETASAREAAPLAFATNRSGLTVATKAASASPADMADQSAQTEPETPQVKAFVTSDTLLPEEDMHDREKLQADLAQNEPQPLEGTTAPIAPDAREEENEELRKNAQPRIFATKRSAQLSASEARALAQAATLTPDPPAGETQRMTFFSSSNVVQAVGTRRHMAASLAAVLVVALIGVAGWASIFGNTEADQQADASQTLSLPDDNELLPIGTAQTETDIVDLPRTIEQELPETALPREPTGNADLGVEHSDDIPDAEAEPTIDVQDEMVASAPEPDQVTSPIPEAETHAFFDNAGILQRAPDTLATPGTQTQSDVYQTSIDPEVTTQDAVALPGASAFAPDSQPVAIPDPAPPGTRFSLDERGLVRAAPEGALSPDGILVFSGRPALLPPQRPVETLEAVEENDLGENILGLSETQIAQIAEVRPRVRPENLSEQNERGALGTGGRTQAELAALRPNPRPQSPQELAEQAATASTVGLTDQQDADEAFAGATDQAVSRSILPKGRPENFGIVVALAVQAAEARAIETAQREAARQAEQQAQREAQQTAQQQAQQAASASQSASLAQPVIEPEDTERVAAAAVPRSQRVRPGAPTASSVARAATEENVLRLRRINLIGVYGGASDRRALVRLANGRYKKVAVGDRLDGGRVTAIGSSELRYSKGGRDLALKMPKG